MWVNLNATNGGARGPRPTAAGAAPGTNPGPVPAPRTVSTALTAAATRTIGLRNSVAVPYRPVLRLLPARKSLSVQHSLERGKTVRGSRATRLRPAATARGCFAVSLRVSEQAERLGLRDTALVLVA